MTVKMTVYLPNERTTMIRWRINLLNSPPEPWQQSEGNYDRTNLIRVCAAHISGGVSTRIELDNGEFWWVSDVWAVKERT